MSTLQMWVGFSNNSFPLRILSRNVIFSFCKLFKILYKNSTFEGTMQLASDLKFELFPAKEVSLDRLENLINIFSSLLLNLLIKYLALTELK